MILSCIYRIYEYLGYSLGVTLIVRVLHGSKEKRITDLQLDRLPTYGIMRNVPRTKIRDMIAALEAQEYILTSVNQGDVNLTGKAANVLFNGEKVKMLVRTEEKMSSNEKAYPARTSIENGLLEELKMLRLELAKEENVPAYVIFSNATLQDMVMKEPVTMEEFLRVSGVGKYKAEHYGKAFIAAIQKYKGGVSSAGI